MSVIWVIEKQEKAQLSAAEALLGNFAVRLFASIDSFRTLSRIKGGPQPDLVVLDADDFPKENEPLAVVAETLAQTPCVVLDDSVSEPGQPQAAGAYLYYPKPFEPLDLCRFLGAVLDQSETCRNETTVLRYKDLAFDCDVLEIKAAGGDDATPLPFKEGRILKLFLEQPGECLTRERIREQVWKGMKVASRTIDSHVSRLRKRLQGTEAVIRSVYGDGYVLE